jgi:exosortase/archaeosortase family protein
MLQGASALWLWRGAAAVRVAALPLAFLLFAMPIPASALNELIFWLQIATAEIAGHFLYLLEIPHFVAGEQIRRTEHVFTVIETCSGLRSIQTLTMVSVLMMDLFRRPPRHAWLVVLAAPPVAFFLNGIRALLLILNPYSEVIAIHNLQGVAILMTGLVLIFLWDGLLERVLPLPSPRAGAPAASPKAPRPRPPAPPALVLTLAIASVLSLWIPRWEKAPVIPIAASARFASALGISEDLPVDRRFLGSVGFQESFVRRFELGEDDVVLFFGVGRRDDRLQSPLSPKNGIPASGWVVESEEEVVLDGDERVRARVMRSGSRRVLAYHWYRGSRGWRAEALRDLLALDRSPWRRPGEILAIRLVAPIHGPLASGRELAREKLLRFYEQMRPMLDEIEQELRSPVGGGAAGAQGLGTGPGSPRGSRV